MRTARIVLSCVALCLLAARGGGGEKPGSQVALVEEKIMPRVAELRGLEFTRPVAIKMVTPADVAAYVRKTLAAEVSPEELEGTERILVYMGLLEKGADLRQTLIDTYTQQVAGFYDDREKTFSIVANSDMPPDVDAMTIAHELTHALQDQHYDLESLREISSENDDLSLAVMSLAEGDASDIMLRYSTKAYARGQGPPKDYSAVVSFSVGSSSMPSMPMVIAQNITFPYKYGSRFVAELSRRAGDGAIDLAFEAPPMSSEQVMNVDKYLGHDEPYIIEMPDLSGSLGSGWRRLEQSTLGQFNLGLYLVNSVGDWGVDDAIRPWKGDTMAAYAGPRDDDFIFIYYSTWDSEEAAVNFARAYRRVIESRFSSLVLTRDAAGSATWTGDGKVYCLKQSGCDVVSVENVPFDLAGKAIVGVKNSPKVPLGILYPIDDRQRRPFDGDGGAARGESSIQSTLMPHGLRVWFRQ